MNRILLVLCVILLLVCPMAFAQNLGTGLYAFGSFDSRGFDSINLGNLNSHFEIPIVNKAGRGLPFGYSLVYDGLIWSPSTTTGTGTWVPDPNWGFHGQLLGGAAYSGYLTYSSLSTSCPPIGSRNINGNFYTNYVYHDPYGKNHRFNYSLKSCPLTDTGDGTVTGNGSSSDGSGLTYNLSDFKVHTRNGSIINAPTYVGSGSSSNGSITDSNGNMITNNGNGTFTDTLGVTALTITGSGTPASSLTLTYPVTLQASGASTASATIAYKAYTVQTNFQCSGIAEYGATSVNLVDHITLADGSTYSFTYETTPNVSTSVTGRLASITLPTGGTISYVYSGGCNSSAGTGIYADGTVGNLSRTTSDSSNPRTYTRTTVNSNASSTQVQDEKGNQAKYQFTITAGMFYETHQTVYQGAVGGTALRDVFTCYNGAAPPCDGAAMAQPISQTNSLTSYNGGSQLGVINVYDALGGLTSSTQQSGSTVLQKTTYSYNSLEEVASVSQFDGNGTAYAFTYYGFDESTPTATSGIPSHTPVSGTRGNVTSAHVSIGGPYLVTNTTYYDTGVPMSVTTPNGTTNYGYDATQTFATSTTLPTPPSGVQLATSASFDPESGAQLSSTGLNSGQTTQYTQYDGLLRPTIITPPNVAGQVTINYTPTQTGVIQAMNNGQNTTTSTLLDAYGRKSRVAIYNGQSSNPWYQTDYCYDATGLLQFQSSQYQGNGWTTPKQCSGNGTSYTYDALGRMLTSANYDGTITYQYNQRATETTDVNNVQRITQYDLLGRISGICEISSNNSMPGSGPASSCAMDIAGTGFATSYTYNLAARTTTINQGGQLRTFVVDGIGRPTSITEPERGQTTYSYTYNASGLQVVRTRPRANQANLSVTTTTTTQYDSVGRVISVVYNDGTLPKYFGYDTSTGWGFNQTYIKGQLTTAFEGPSPSAAVTALSYDAMGRLNAMQSCEPSVCAGTNSFRGARSLGYDLAGNLTSSSDPVSGTISYGRSPAGEVTSITNQTYPQTHVSNVVNGPAGPISYSLGNGLNVYTQYDSMDRAYAQWLCAGPPAYSCGNQVYGTDVYLKGSRVTASDDTLIGPYTSFGYDEFNRLTSANYGNGAKTFSYAYDRWGNRTSQSAPQGGPAPSYAYNTANNQIQGFNYDAAGNLLNDAVHSYSYDAEGNLMSVDGGATAKYVYDAFNRRVSQQTSSGTYEYLYDPTGKRTSRWNANWGDEGRIYWDGRQIAFRAEDGSTFYDHQNLMGTERVRSNSVGSIVGTYNSLPWGDGYASTSSGFSDQDTLKYAQLDHDSESGTEHAQFRQLSSTSGRWMSPDPYDGSYDPTNPQSLNRYSYVLNNPLSKTDHLGLDDGANDCGDGEGDGGSGSGGGGGGGGDPIPLPVVLQSVTVTADPPPTVDTTVLWNWITSGITNWQGSSVGVGSSAPSKPTCTSGPSSGGSIVSGSVTVPLTNVGAAVGGLFGPVGAFAGGIIGSMFGAGGTVSYVPSTGSLYVGPLATFGIGLGGGGGFSASYTSVPANQNPNSIANGTSYSVGFQPTPLTGSTVTKSPGSGAPVVGYQVGSRVPVSYSASHTFCIGKCGC